MSIILLDWLLFRICRQYDEMADRVSEVPETTQELVETQEYLKTVSLKIIKMSNYA